MGIRHLFQSPPEEKTLDDETSDRRSDQEAIPKDIMLTLTQDQLISLETLEFFGWELQFIRRSDPNNRLFVFWHREYNDYACMDETGDVTIEPEIKVRDIAKAS